VTVWSDLAGLEFCQRYVDAAGLRTRSLQTGAGEALVLLHGTSGHLEGFSRNVPAYARHFQVHAIDMLGHGYTDKPDGPYTIPRYVRHLLDYLDACGIGKAHLAGQSLGGWVAAWAASEHPDRVRSLSLLAPGGTVADPRVMEQIRTSTRTAVEDSDPAGTRRRLEWLMADPDASVTDELVAIRHAIYQQPEMKEHIDNILVLQDMKTRLENLLTPERLGSITAPTLVVWTTEDPTTTLAEGRTWAEAIPGARLEIVERAGHWPHYEQAARFNQLHLDFLLSASP
jgi:2-hydroxy-6-oxonona-2,4-dienedioate hydrolase